MARQPALDYRRILVCQLRQIGDVLLATPAVRMLKSAWPEAEIHFFTEKKCAPMLAHNPDLAEVWEVDRSVQSNLFKEIPFYRRVARQGFDLVVDFQQLPRIRWVVAFSRAGVRLSFTPPWYNRWLYTHTVDPLPGYAAMSKASILRRLGLEYRGEKPRLHLTRLERAWSSHFLQEHRVGADEFLVTVDPTHRRATRMWPAEKWAGLIDLAAAAFPKARFAVLYGPGEREVAESVAAKAKRSDRIILPGRVLTLRELASLIAAASLHLGNCSAPRHMAVALDVPSLIVLGATSEAWTCPDPAHATASLELDCRPCNENSCPKGRTACLEDLAPEAVLARAEPFLANAR